jgi:hypothetical protein
MSGRAPTPRIDIAADQTAKVEGDTGDTLFTFTVTRSGDQSGVSSAAWAVLAGDTQPEDFVGGVLPSGVITFDVGEATAQIIVAVSGDTVFEQDESFSVQLSSPVNCSIGVASASSIIVNEPAHYVPAAAQHMVVSIEPRDATAGPSHDNCWIKQMYVTAWRIAGSPETSTALLLETPAGNAWWGHMGPDGSILEPNGQWFASIQAFQEAYLAAWQARADGEA